MDVQRVGERLCFIALGWLIARTAGSYEISPALIPVYAAMAAAILAARWAVVSRRERRDRERAESFSKP
jgi:hypothetical protein